MHIRTSFSIDWILIMKRLFSVVFRRIDTRRYPYNSQGTFIGIDSYLNIHDVPLPHILLPKRHWWWPNGLWAG